MRDIRGLAYAKAECDTIKRRLSEHLLEVKTYLTGRQVTAIDSVRNVTPELFFALFTLIRDQPLESLVNKSFASLGLGDETTRQAFYA